MIEVQPNPETGGQRLIAVGALGAPDIVTQAHFDSLPNKDARSSHLERFIAQGLDLTGFDLRDVTTLDGTIANSNLYGAAASGYWYSRGCAFPNTDLPRDASSLHHDFALALIRKYIAANPQLHRQITEALDSANATVSDYIGSWDDGIEKMARVLGLSGDEVRRFFTPAFERHPRMLTRLTQESAKGAWSADKYAPPWPVWKKAAKVQARLTNRNDRFEARRLLDGDLDIVGPRHYVLQWEPDPYLFTIPSPREWGWWEKSSA